MSAPPRRRRFRERRKNHSSDAEWNGAKRSTRIPKWIPKRLHTPLRITWRLFLAGTLLSLAVILFYLCLSFRYDLRKVSDMAQRSVVLDATGRELGSLHGANRRLIPRDEIPPFLVDALEAREDARFFEHHGIDFRGVGRATFRNLRDRSFTQGASTLTMQLVRNTYDLWDSTLHRKFLETALSWRVEAHYSKDEILSHYLNRIYFGSGCYGLEEAALTYFGVKASDLNRNQCSLLVGIIRAPHGYSPFRNLRGAAVQRDEVLNRLIITGKLAQSEYQEIRSLPLNLQDGPSTESTQALRSTRRHFNELLLDVEREEGGLTIRTTINAPFQQALEKTLSATTDSLPPEWQCGALCLDSKTGAIRAVVAARESSLSNFNHALDIKRDLGAVFAPFLATMAAERNHPLYPNDPVRMGRPLGRTETLRLAKRLGLTGNAAEETDDVYRGSLTASPLQVATAAATLINRGQRPRSYFIDQILSSSEQSFFRHHPSAISSFRIDAVAAALEGAGKEQGTPLVLGGFSPGKRDYWVIVFGEQHALALWLGQDDPKSLDFTETQQSALKNALRKLAHKL